MPARSDLPRPGIPYEPQHLEYLTVREATDAVVADIRAHQPLPLNEHGHFTATRHVSLLTSLLNQVANDSHYNRFEWPTPRGQRNSAQLAEAAVPIAQALTHYVQALEPMARLALSIRPEDSAADRAEIHRHVLPLDTLLDHAQAAVRRRPPTPVPVPASPEAGTARQR
ncbi:hypothetical protein [Streptomyces yangpuensis]|uniref:hypothetical protein n=1 Tax=Streptomyces yangpuensis TaxID=1648182 RepID=UPI00381F5221